MLITTELQNQLLLGILPTPKTEGGLIGQAIAMVAGDQRKLQVEMSEENKLKIAQANKNQEGYVVSTNDNGERIVTFKDGSTAPLTVNKTDLDDFNSGLKLEVKKGAGNLVADLKVNKDNSLNGIVNNEDEAIKNGLKQMGVLQSNTLNVLYDPTHGLASDVLEVGWNWALGKTPLKSGNLYELNTYGQNVAEAAKANDITGLRYVGHSGGGDRLYQGIIYGATENAFKGTDTQLQFYGSPLYTPYMREAAKSAGILNSEQIQHQINPGDYVGENLGWRNSSSLTDKILGPFNPVAIATKVPQLFLDSSPHSAYFCEGSFCGYDRLNNNQQ